MPVLRSVEWLRMVESRISTIGSTYDAKFAALRRFVVPAPADWSVVGDAAPLRSPRHVFSVVGVASGVDQFVAHRVADDLKRRDAPPLQLNAATGEGDGLQLTGRGGARWGRRT